MNLRGAHNSLHQRVESLDSEDYSSRYNIGEGGGAGWGREGEEDKTLRMHVSHTTISIEELEQIFPATISIRPIR